MSQKTYGAITETQCQHIYGRTRLDGYLTKKMGIFALLYVPIGDYSTIFEVFK